MAKTIKCLSAPVSVALMITRRCNLRCLHCGSSPEQFLREDMTTEEILATIEELARCKVFRVSITGGEPLLHPAFFTIVDAIMQRPFSVQLNTNATLVTADIARRLRALPRHIRISVSVDGVTPETYDQVRGAGAFTSMLRGIKLLKAVGLAVRPFVVLSRLNYQELPEIARFAKSIGTRTVNVVPPSACGRATRHGNEMRLSRDELRETLAIATSVMDNNPGLITGSWANLVNLYRKLKEGGPQEHDTVNRRFLNCGGGRVEAAIAADGTVVPCELSYLCRAGNLRDQSFSTIWRDSPVFRTIRETQGMPLAQVHGCEDCSWHHVCRGPCPAGGHAMTGVWPAAEPVCITREISDLYATDTAVQEKRKAS